MCHLIVGRPDRIGAGTAAAARGDRPLWRRDGLQVSWWVAAQAVAGADRHARNWRLRLTNGLTVPVVRKRVIEARTRGWIVEETS
jgi:hypothetical protein